MRSRHVLGMTAGAAILLGALFFGREFPGEQPTVPTQTQQTQTQSATVTRVVDGDTLVTDTGARVRVIGGDTPETTKGKNQCYGQESDKRTAELTLGKTVTLAADPTQDDADRFKRKLRYVTLPDGSDLMEHLIREGYAREVTYDGRYERQDVYRNAQAQAKLEFRGRWAVCGN